MTTNWTGILGTGWVKGQIGLEHVKQVYIHAFKWLLIGTALAVALGIGLNNIGWKEGNFILALIFLIASTFCFFYPGFLIWVFGLGSINGLPKDWSLNRLLKEQVLPDLQFSHLVKEGVDAIKQTVQWAAHITLFTQMFFVVLGTWELENSRVILPILVVLASIGLCTYLFSGGAVWYKRAAWGIMLTSLGIFVYNGYVYMHPQDAALKDVSWALQKNDDSKKQAALSVLLEKTSDGIPLTPKEASFLKQMGEEARSRSVTGFADDLFYSKTFDFEIENFLPQQLCGVRPGKRTYTVPGELIVPLDGGVYNITGFVRVNGIYPGESFEVDDTGCVRISFDMRDITEETLAKKFVKRVAIITFD